MHPNWAGIFSQRQMWTQKQHCATHCDHPSTGSTAFISPFAHFHICTFSQLQTLTFACLCSCTYSHFHVSKDVNSIAGCAAVGGQLKNWGGCAILCLVTTPANTNTNKNTTANTNTNANANTNIDINTNANTNTNINTNTKKNSMT